MTFVSQISHLGFAPHPTYSTNVLIANSVFQGSLYHAVKVEIPNTPLLSHM